MSKTVTFEFWHLNIIHKNNENLVSFKEIATMLETKPLDLSKENHRYFCNNGICNKAISRIYQHENGILVNFSKYDRDNIKGSYFNDGDVEFDAINEIEKSTQRKDVAILDYNGIKIFSNGIIIFQNNQKANTPLQFKDYLLHHFVDAYKIELIPIYVDDLFSALDDGEIQNIELTVGFAPDSSFDVFDNESYTGATKCTIKFQPEQKQFLNKVFFIKTLASKALDGFGALNNGVITKASAKITNRHVRVSLEEYKLVDKKIFKEIRDFWINPNKYFDEMYKIHHDFLEKYILRDTRYK
jgi:hypothetical protein